MFVETVQLHEGWTTHNYVENPSFWPTQAQNKNKNTKLLKM
jgi:hypothetical protein